MKSILRYFTIIITSINLILASTMYTLIGNVSLSSWKSMCNQLPSWREFKLQGPAKRKIWETKIQDIYATGLFKDFKDEFTKTLTEFTKKMRELMTNARWHDNNQPDLKVTPDKFFLFVQKKSLARKGSIAIWGDLHGSANSFLAGLDDLKIKGFINDAFKIIKPNSYIILLGDYVDRGPYGLETWYTIMRLKLANPDKVFLIRGNHETRGQNKKARGFISELEKKIGKIPADKLYKKIENMYNLLPATLFLNIDQFGTIQCCHGGVEIGYNPQKFLAEAASEFHLIETLERETNFKQLNKDSQDSIKQILKDSQRILQTQPEHDMKNFRPRNKNGIGFWWTDFNIKDDSEYWVNLKPKRTWTYGRNTTKDILDNFGLIGMLRGHQQGESEMRDALLDNKGLKVIWGEEKVSHSFPIDLAAWVKNNGPFVVTLTAGTESGIVRPQPYDSYAMFELQNLKIYPVNLPITKYAATIAKAKQFMKMKPLMAAKIYEELIEKGRYKVAEEAAEQWREKSPHLAIRMYEALIKKGRHKKAEEAADQWMENNPEEAAEIYLALIKKGRYKKAEHAADQWMENNPEEAAEIYLALIEAGQYKSAKHAAKQWMEKNLSLSFELFDALAKKGQVSEAAISAVNQGTISANRRERMWAEQVKKKLIELGKWPKEQKD